ncbi:MAG: hypothetical protein MAG431_00190 [Chloroflexi bacterium]|nr:hypothetical protein [Chloroflexota bacterium]
MQTWSFRDEILRMTRQWYIVLAFIVAGGLLGLGGAYLYPAPYRATADLYVGIDVIRVGEMAHVIPLAETEPLNLDDYKNWQLKQVADVISSEKVLTKTLDSLREQDAYWDQVKTEVLAERMDIYWYDAGNWRLEVIHPQTAYAAQAVEAWREAGYTRVEELLVHAEHAAELDAELQSANTSIGIVEEKIASLEPGTALEDAQEELALLTTKREEILDEYHQAQDDSLGLSANLYLEPSSSLSQEGRVRSTGTVTLVAGGIGFLVWVLVAFLRTGVFPPKDRQNPPTRHDRESEHVGRNGISTPPTEETHAG